ncbi:uncharacterized protein, partial [Littorina saxatilis]|uniref:uncharacterized protein n=1 Tax=Littorina saxatilis TaxID=31220 RepID=UPI0038B49319
MAQGCTNWLTQLSSDSGSWVVMGDFNAHHRMWDADAESSPDTQLAEDISISDLVLLNDGTATRQAQRQRERSSAIDLTLVSPELALTIDWQVYPNTLGSDHYLIHATIHEADPDPAEVDRTPKYICAKADWEKFKKTLTHICGETEFKDNDIDQYY